MTTNAIGEFRVTGAAIAATDPIDLTLTVTAPVGTVMTDTVTATWTESFTNAAVQDKFRVQVFYRDQTTALYDSGSLGGTDLSFPVPFTLSAGSLYTLTVTVVTSLGIVIDASSDFQLDTSVASEFDPNTEVGTVYEVGINGRGYMLHDNEVAEPTYKYQRATVPLDADRLVTSATPLSESVQRYLFSAESDWIGGAGQPFKDRKGAAGDSFWSSDGVDTTVKSKLTLLNSMSREFASAYAPLDLAIVGTSMYAVTAAKTITYVSAPGVASSAFTVAAAGTLSDIVGDGSNWYACDGTSVWRNTTNADPGAAWSTANIVNMGWGASRLVGSYAGAGSSTPNIFTTLNDAGAEEVGGGRLTLPAGWTIQSFCAGSGNVFFCAYQGDQGAVYAWDTTSAAPFVSWQLPKGEVPLAICWSQGNVMVLARQSMGTVSRLALYRGAVQSSFSLAGTLVPALITVVGQFENPPSRDYGLQPSLTAYGKLVFWSWPYMSGATGSGVGMFDLSTGGYTKWYKSTVGGQVGTVDVWRGRVVFTVIGDGVWTQNLTSYLTTGYVQGSLVDGDSTLEKLFDQLVMTCSPLASGQSFTVAYSLDGLNTYVAFPAGTLSGSGAKKVTADLDVGGPNIGLQVTLVGDGTSTPTLFTAVVRYHALGLADTMLQLPIDCGDQLKGLNGADLPENGPGVGAARARYLMGLVQSRALVQDVDWADTALSETYEVLQVQTEKVSVYDRSQGKNRLRMVAILTLRKRAR